MRRVLLDCDEVMADFVASYLRLVKMVADKTYTHDDVTQYDIKRSLGLLDSEVTDIVGLIQQPGFCLSIEPIAGAVEGFRALHSVADVYIVTSPWNSCPTWTHERERWLANHFDIHHSRVLHGSAKHLIKGDFLVDDKTDNLQAWRSAHSPDGIAVQWKRTHNRNDGWDGLATNDWEQLCGWVTQ